MSAEDRFRDWWATSPLRGDVLFAEADIKTAYLVAHAGWMAAAKEAVGEIMHQSDVVHARDGLMASDLVESVAEQVSKHFGLLP